MQNNIVLTRGTRIFFLLFFGFVLLSVAATYYRYMVLEEYEIWIEYDEDGNPINVEFLEEEL